MNIQAFLFIGQIPLPYIDLLEKFSCIIIGQLTDWSISVTLF